MMQDMNQFPPCTVVAQFISLEWHSCISEISVHCSRQWNHLSVPPQKPATNFNQGAYPRGTIPLHVPSLLFLCIHCWGAIRAYSSLAIRLFTFYCYLNLCFWCHVLKQINMMMMMMIIARYWRVKTEDRQILPNCSQFQANMTTLAKPRIKRLLVPHPVSYTHLTLPTILRV